MLVTSVRDRVADRFLGLDLSINDKAACRDFVLAMDRLMRDKSGYAVSSVDDFEVWYLGEFDEENGSFYQNVDSHVLMTGFQARRELESFYSVLDDDESEE